MARGRGYRVPSLPHPWQVLAVDCGRGNAIPCGAGLLGVTGSSGPGPNYLPGGDLEGGGGLVPVPLTLHAVPAAAFPTEPGDRLQKWASVPSPGAGIHGGQRGFETGPGSCSTAPNNMAEAREQYCRFQS